MIFLCLQDIKVVTVLGGTVEDTELINGLLLTQKVCAGPKKVEKAKIGLIQFCISPPKTDVIIVRFINKILTCLERKK